MTLELLICGLIGGFGALAIWGIAAIYAASNPNRSKTDCRHGVLKEYCPECQGGNTNG